MTIHKHTTTLNRQIISVSVYKVLQHIIFSDPCQQGSSPVVEGPTQHIVGPIQRIQGLASHVNVQGPTQHVIGPTQHVQGQMTRVIGPTQHVQAPTQFIQELNHPNQTEGRNQQAAEPRTYSPNVALNGGLGMTVTVRMNHDNRTLSVCKKSLKLAVVVVVR